MASKLSAINAAKKNGIGFDTQDVADGKDASKIIRQAAKHIKGGGGGQKHFASAGGKEPSGLQNAVSEIRNAVSAN